MRISSKGRYGLAAMISMAQTGNDDGYITIISIAEKLGISKIYLEQVFSLLKRAELVTSVKGAQGGYQLTKAPSQITAGAILRAIEVSLFEKTDRSVADEAIEIEKVMETFIWNPLDDIVFETLKSILLSDLANEATKQKADQQIMFYI